MEQNAFMVPAKKEPKITLEVTPGHFTTSSTHTNYYLNVNRLTHNVRIAQDVAKELAIPYKTSAMIDTIVCIENTQVLAAYLAQELVEEGIYVMNEDRDVNIVTPTSNMNGQLIFSKDVMKLIEDKSVMLLLATVSSGKTMRRALDCLKYYNGVLVGVSALFSTKPQIDGQDINAIFSSDDIPNYQFDRPATCPMCMVGQPLDAIVSAGGYMKL